MTTECCKLEIKVFYRSPQSVSKGAGRFMLHGTQPEMSVMYPVLKGASSKWQPWIKSGPKQPSNLSCLFSLGARAEGQQLQRVKHVLHRGE